MEDEGEKNLPRRCLEIFRNERCCLEAGENIKNMQVIMEIELKNTISAEFVKNIWGIEDLLIQDEQLICLYLIKLIQMQKKQSNKRVQSWINSVSSGFIDISKQLIRATCDDDLIIQHAAYCTHVEQQGLQIYNKLIGTQILSQIAPNITSNQFQKKYRWACQFRNTRAFGHTKDTILIPQIDYMNYNPTKSCKKVILLTYQNHNQIPELVENYKCEAFQKIESQIEDEDENESQSGEFLPERKYIGLVAIEDIEKGEQILFHYGKFSNRYLLSWYGYSIQNNPYDYLHIYVKRYWQQPLISFSAIERSTTKIKLKKSIRNPDLYESWKHVTEKKSYKPHLNEKQIVSEMIQYLKIAKKKLNYSKTQNQWVNIYCEERIRIYESQVELWQSQLSMLL